MTTPTGRVLSSNLSRIGLPPTSSKDSNINTNRNKICVGQVMEVLFTDDPRNSSGGKAVEYIVRVNEDSSGENIYSNVRGLDSLGSETDFCEIILNDSSNKSITGIDSNSNINAPLYRSGSMVEIGFQGGDKSQPFIIRPTQHPSVNHTKKESNVRSFASSGSSTSRDERLQALPKALPGAKKEGVNEGKRILFEFNGVRILIGSNGELTVIQQGLKNPDGSLVDGSFEKFPTVLKFNQDGEIFILDNKDQEIKISPKEGKITISDGNEDPNYILLDRNEKTIALKAKDIVMSADSIKQSADVDCLNVAKNWTLLSEGTITIAANGALILKGSVGALVL